MAPRTRALMTMELLILGLWLILGHGMWIEVKRKQQEVVCLE